MPCDVFVGKTTLNALLPEVEARHSHTQTDRSPKYTHLAKARLEKLNPPTTMQFGTLHNQKPVYLLTLPPNIMANYLTHLGRRDLLSLALASRRSLILVHIWTRSTANTLLKAVHRAQTQISVVPRRPKPIG